MDIVIKNKKYRDLLTYTKFSALQNGVSWLSENPDLPCARKISISGSERRFPHSKVEERRIDTINGSIVVLSSSLTILSIEPSLLMFHSSTFGSVSEPEKPAP